MPKAIKPENHRTRVGAERRQRMRARLIECSLAVFAEQGMDASIDDVIAAAEVSRGTFYNYFQTSHEVLRALGDELAKELVSLVEETVVSYEDPVQRVGVGIRLFLHLARAHAPLAAFFWRTAFHASTAFVVARAYLPRHIEEGIRAGSFHIESAELGIHIIAGLTLSGTYGLSTLIMDRAYPEQITRGALLALGATRKHADKVVAMPLPPLAIHEGSLLARTLGASESP